MPNTIFMNSIMVMLLISTSLMIGCSSSINTTPFAEFQSSAMVLRDGTQQATSVLLPQHLVQMKVENGMLIDNNDIDKIMHINTVHLKEQKTYPLQIKSLPMYLQIDHFSQSLLTTTDAMYQYTALLYELVSSDSLTKEELSVISTEINASAMSGISSLNPQMGEQGAQNVGLISTAFTASIDAYLKKNKKDQISDFISANQQMVDAYSILIKQAIDTVGADSIQYYQDAQAKIKLTMLLDKSAALALIDEMVNSNRAFYQYLKKLQALKAATIAFPKAHRALLTAVKNETNNINAVTNFMTQAKRVQVTSKLLGNNNKNIILKAEVENIESEAIALETVANKARYAASMAQAKAVSARIKADATADNPEQTKLAITLEKIASELDEKATQKEITAAAMRAAYQGLVASSNSLLIQ